MPSAWGPSGCTRRASSVPSNTNFDGRTHVRRARVAEHRFRYRRGELDEFLESARALPTRRTCPIEWLMTLLGRLSPGVGSVISEICGHQTYRPVPHAADPRAFRSPFTDGNSRPACRPGALCVPINCPSEPAPVPHRLIASREKDQEGAASQHHAASRLGAIHRRADDTTCATAEVNQAVRGLRSRDRLRLDGSTGRAVSFRPAAGRRQGRRRS